MIARVKGRTKPWGMVVIDGGVTGAGVALDAASQGYEVLLSSAKSLARELRAAIQN
jgi:glycerol-3-phosphate dehydrogenase